VAIFSGTIKVKEYAKKRDFSSINKLNSLPDLQRLKKPI